MITIKINEIDKTNFVKTDSLKKTDNLNQRVDTLEFVMYKYDNKGSKPVLGSEVKLFDGSNLIYGGVIITIEDYLDFNKEINYVVKCKDFSHYLDKVLVVEKYKNQTVNEIIKDIYYKYVIDWRKGSDGVSIPYADDVYSFEYPLVDGAPGGWLSIQAIPSPIVDFMPSHTSITDCFAPLHTVSQADLIVFKTFTK